MIKNETLYIKVSDKNGNIQTLVRNGDTDTNGYQYEQEIDDLEYAYATNSNKLTKVFDKSANPQGFKDNTDGVTNSIADDYDENGNMTRVLGFITATTKHSMIKNKYNY